MPKSGNVTIRLGPSEVKRVLENPPIGIRGRFNDRFRRHNGDSVQRKLYKAVAAKFTDVEKEMMEEQRVYNIVHEAHRSDEAQEIEASIAERRKTLDDEYTALNTEKCRAIQELTQAKFDEAGITNFVADGYGWRKVEPATEKE